MTAEEVELLVERVRRGVIGEGGVFDGPYGPRRLTYADYTASGRALDFVEDYVREQVLPFYANTHTEASLTGSRTGRLREQARELIHRSVGGTDEHVVIFCGSGATAAVHKLVAILGLRLPETLEDQFGLSAHIPADRRPVVLVGPYEHHSNELPWRESIADVVEIAETGEGGIDQDDLRRQLVAYAGRPLIIGSFSAASNVTGIISDSAGLARILHEHGALSFWDYAAAGPYLPIRMTGKDAIFLSPHKFPGGPQTPGVLVVRRDLLTNRVPTGPGGGTVAFVGPDGHRYLDDPVAREEGGTPAVVESIRAGMVFALKEAVGPAGINAREQRLWERLRRRWQDEPAISVLGDPRAERLPIVSFRIRPQGRDLHHNFVVAVLNDVFGIQSRGGCSCAGPYGHRLLGIAEDQSRRFQAEIEAGYEGIKPGWSRFNLNYFFSDRLADYLAEAVVLIARHGRRLLADYRFDPLTGLWVHAGAKPDEAGLGDFLAPGGLAPARPPLGEDVLDEQLAHAREIFAARPEPAEEELALPASFEALRWFHLPAACLEKRNGAAPGGDA